MSPLTKAVVWVVSALLAWAVVLAVLALTVLTARAVSR